MAFDDLSRRQWAFLLGGVAVFAAVFALGIDAFTDRSLETSVLWTLGLLAAGLLYVWLDGAFEDEA